MKRADRGFTLIEMLLVVSIIAVLAAIAFPQFGEVMKRGKRAEGKSALLAAAQKMERYNTNNGRYPSTMAEAGVSDKSNSESPGSSAYNIAVAAGATGSLNTSWVFTATPVFSDPKCGNFLIDNLGSKTISGAVAETTRCWQ
jgi:type IV pilus assembly protein PilE